MRNEKDSGRKLYPSPSFSKTAREWILASALYDGIEDEDIRQIEILLAERGANPNILLPEYGITPFHLVVANESIKFAVHATDICLQHGADPNVRSEDGLTPVHLAAMWGCTEVLRVLLASGGNPWLVDCLNKNAFDYAQSEGQLECHNILKLYCNSQPKPSSHSKSPYQLNLKRVILYKNDLQIVYEAIPSSSHKSASTQTSPPILKPNLIKDVSNGYSQKNIVPSTMQRDNLSSKVDGKDNVFLCKKTKEQCTSVPNKCKSYATKNDNHAPVSSRLKEIIVQHRRNSTIFEYCPHKENQDSLSSGVVSGDLTTSVVSELIEKLEQTNRIRQSMKSNDTHSELLKNITQRKKPLQPVEKILSREESLTDDSSLSNGSCQNRLSQNENDCELNGSKAVCSILSTKHSEAMNFESPHSIGSFLDNIDKTFPQTRGSSLFSDIASDVEVLTTPRMKSDSENIMTEDDCPVIERHFSKYSSSDSLYPCVSCDGENTREVEAGECFESCLERLPGTAETPMLKAESEPEQSITTDVHTLMDSILNNIDVDQRTPVNPKLVTSTPERISTGSDNTSFSSAVDRKWVEAEVSSSSDDELFMSVSEEYEYTDLDEGVVLIEKHYLLNDVSVSANVKKQGSNVPGSATESEVSTISGSEGAYDTDELRRALREYGFTPGPITGNTKRVYLRKLKRYRKKPVPPPPQIGQPAYSPELLKTLAASCDHLLQEWGHLEDSMSASFTCPRRPWREGQAKTSFTYLLLDPRLAHNLPASAHSVPHTQIWPDFLRSIFYVGKGKRSRPYAHLYKAVTIWKSQDTTSSKKIQRILDIWKSGQGVVCLHVFLNIIPVEAFTREAAMISALTLAQVTNEKAGEFYGTAACWSLRLKHRLGCVLLHRAFKVFLAEGERQLRPSDID